MLLENFQSYDEKLSCLFIPKYIFVSPAKQKRDICIAFPAASLSSSSAKTFLCLGHFLRNFKG